MQYRGEEEPVSCNIINPNSQPWDSNLGDPEHFNMQGFQDFIQDNYGRWQFSDEYINKNSEDICNPDEFTLSEHQKLLGQWINPKNPEMRGCLIWHGLGSGKTCTATVIRIAREIWNNNRQHQKRQPLHTVIVTPAALTEQWRDEMLKEGHCASQCLTKENEPFVPYPIGDPFQKENQKFKEIPSAKKRAYEYKTSLDTDLSDIHLDIVSHDEFLNDTLKENAKQYIKMHRLREKKRKSRRTKKTWVNLLDPNKLIIIDEIHKLVSIKGTKYRSLLYAIQNYIHPTTTIVLLSATPLFDQPIEIGLTLNLLRPPVPFPITREEFQTWFQGSVRNAELHNKKLFQLMATGYISYFSGGNPNAYPDKITTFVHHKLSEIQEDQYGDALIAKLQEQPDNDNTDRTTDYIKIMNTFDLNQDLKSGDEMSAGWMTPILQIANIALPDPYQATYDYPRSTNMSNNIKIQERARSKLKELLETARDDTTLNIIPNLECFKTRPMGDQNNFEFAYNYPPEDENARVVQYLNKLSSKDAWILNSILTTPGTAFIYTSWVAFGAKVWKIIFEAIGWSEWSRTNREGEFFIWSGDVVSKKQNTTRLAQKSFNAGEIKVLIGTRSVTEGVDLKQTSNVHICDPWWNESRIEQVIARAIRRCSHSKLPQSGRQVMVYRHTSVLSEYPKITEDMRNKMEITDGAQKGIKKLLDINSVETVQQNTSIKKLEKTNTFRSALKEIAFDCNLMKNGNLIKFYRENIPIYEKRGRAWISSYQTTWVDPSDYSHWKIIRQEEDHIRLRKMNKIFYGPKNGWAGYQTFREEYIQEFKSNLNPDDDLDKVIQSAFMNLDPDQKFEYAEKDNSKPSTILFRYEEEDEEKIINSNLITQEDIDCCTENLSLATVDVNDPYIINEVNRLYSNYNFFRHNREEFFDKDIHYLLKCIENSYKISNDAEYKTKVELLFAKDQEEKQRQDIIDKLPKILRRQYEHDPDIKIHELREILKKQKK